MHMNHEAFGAMRIGAYWEAWWAYTEEKNADRRHVGELARGMAIRLFNIELDKKDRIRRLNDVWSMPWDEESEEDAIVEKLNALSDEERDQKAREFMNKLGWRK